MSEHVGRVSEMPEDQVVSIWSDVTVPHGARQSYHRPGTFRYGLYYIADVRTQEPRSHASLRLSSLRRDGNYHIYVNDMSRDHPGENESYLRAVGLVAAIAAGMTQNGVVIDRIAVQGAYDNAAAYEADITAAYGVLIEEASEAK